MENGFDLKKWENVYQYFHKNETNMEAKLHTEIEDGNIVVTVTSLKDEYLRYKDQLECLALDVAKGAYVIAFNSLCKPQYPSAEEYEDEAAQGRQCLVDNMMLYMNTLFNEGLEAFYTLLVTQLHLFECSYQIRHMKYNGIRRVTEKGKYLENGSWISPDGKFYSNMAAAVYEAIIQ